MSEFQDLNFYLLRSPKLSLSKIGEFLNIQEKCFLEDFFKSFYKQEFMNQALFLSSESLYMEVEKWLLGKNPLSKKLAITLYKYTVRLSSRCTPYGHFAGIRTGEIKKTVNNIIDIRRNHKDIVQYRLDMQFLAQIIQHISEDPSIKDRLAYSLNSTLYHQGKYYKFYQQIANSNGNTHYLCQTPVTPILGHIISENDKTYIDWISSIKSIGATEEQANKYIDHLIKSQILTSEIRPQLTAGNGFNNLLRIMESVDTNKTYLPTLNQINNLLHSECSLIDKQRKIEIALRDKIPQAKTKNILQGDLFLGTETNTIPQSTIDRILKQLIETIPLTNSAHVKELEQFKQSFINRYDGQMVGLLEALDPDTGLGYGNNPGAYTSQDILLKDLIPQQIQRQQKTDNSLEELVYRRYHMNYGKHSHWEVCLQESDLQGLASTLNIKPSLPSFYAIGNLLLENTTATPLFCLQACGGTSAGNLISRFSYLDNRLQSKLEELGRFEQKSYPHAIVAEVVHLPENRTGNILQRPCLRKAEIGLIAKANEKVISIRVNELFLFVQKNRLVLWSKKLEKEIIPRLTSAHNFQNGINLYRFLADLQFQDLPLSIKWDWVKFDKQPFLPRIRYKDIILSRAKWNISKIVNIPFCDNEKKKRLATLSKKYNLPNQVVLVEGDNELLLDFANPIAIDIFFEKVSKEDITLYEFIFAEYQSPVKDSEGNVYTNEIIIPIISDVKRKQAVIPPKSLNKKRIYMLGSEWIYVKITCGIRYAEDLLKDMIPSLIQELKNQNLLKRWFFIRYRDPDHHIRLRIEVNSVDNFGSIVQTVNKMFTHKLSEHDISDIQYGTYKREIERYTPEYMDLSEELFFNESEFVLTVIKQIPIPSDRSNICLKYIDNLLNFAGLTLFEKHSFSERMQTAFAAEFGNAKSNEKKLNHIFRKRKMTIEHYLFTEVSNKNMLLPLQHAKVIFDKITCENLSTDAIISKKTSLLSSYIHMFINRLFPSEQRLYEYAFYHLLNSYYQMLIGKRKSLNKQHNNY